MSTSKKILFTFFFFLFFFLLVEGIFRIRHLIKDKRLIPYQLASEKTLELMETWQDWETSYTIYDSNLGWILRPSIEKKKEDFSYKTNKDGLRAEEDYPRKPPGNKIRMGLFGDSFVHGDEVSFQNTFGEQLESLFTQKVETLNFGVSGYGTDQAVIMYQKKGRPYQPQVVILGFLTEHIARNVNRFRRFYVNDLENPFFSKPRFILKESKLELVSPATYNPAEVASFIKSNDLDTLKQHEYFFVPGFYQESWLFHSIFLREWQTKRLKHNFKKKIKPENLFQQPAVVQTSYEIIKHFCELAHQEKAIPLVVTFHFLNDFKKWDSNGQYWKSIVQLCKENNIPILDVGKKLSEDPEFMKAPEKYFLPNGHYSIELNHSLAKMIQEKLKESQEFQTLFQKVTQK